MLKGHVNLGNVERDGLVWNVKTRSGMLISLYCTKPQWNDRTTDKSTQMGVRTATELIPGYIISSAYIALAQVKHTAQSTWLVLGQIL